jgi:hypothetical protein
MKKLTEQQLAILTMVGTFGYLSTKDCARLGWPQSEAHSAHVMAQAMVSKLADGGLLLARDLRMPINPTAEQRRTPPPKTGVAKGYVLTKKAAEVLNDHYAEEWCATDLPEGAAPMMWFADGYNLSLKDHAVRAPLIELCHQMLALWAEVDPLDPTEVDFLKLTAVGPRGCARNFLGLHGYSHFDAVLVDQRWQPAFGIYLADPLTSVATAKVAKLAKQGKEFLIAADRATRLPTLIRWRAETAPELAARVVSRLPTGVEA